MNYPDAHQPTDPQADLADIEEQLPILSLGEMVDAYPNLRPPLIEGLLRLGESMNVISASKIGKSWLVHNLAFAVATGGLWLDSFRCTQGNVLIIDNELHPETSAYRLRRVAESMLIPIEDVGASVSCINLRGRLMDLCKLNRRLRSIERGRFKLVILDAFYRAIPKGTDENDNGQMAELYNLLDFYADSLGASWAIIHHSSKGSQADKAVTDVGSGAGAQSRATDTHLILRPHEEDNAVVLDAAVRSWKPVTPRCLIWDFPLWKPAPDLDASALKRPGGRPAKKDTSTGPDLPKTGEQFAAEFGRPEPEAKGVIIDRAVMRGLTPRGAEQLLGRAVDGGKLYAWQEHSTHGRMLYSTLRPLSKMLLPDGGTETQVGPYVMDTPRIKGRPKKTN